MSDFIITDLLYKHRLLTDKLIVIDCGAAGGSFQEWDSLSDKIIIHGFDPDEDECNRLNANAKSKGLQHYYYPLLIANNSKNRNFYVTNDSASNSLFEPDHQLISRYKQNYCDIRWISTLETAGLKNIIKVNTTSLKNWSEKYLINDIDFIKLDVQGAELEILKGTSNILDQVIGMNIEVWFVPIYKEQPLFADIDVFVRNKKFDFFSFLIYTAGQYAGRIASPVSFGKVNSPFAQKFAGQLLTADALYFKDPLYHNRALSISKKYKLICFAEMNGQIEYAFELLHNMMYSIEQRNVREELSQIIDEAAQKYPRTMLKNHVNNHIINIKRNRIISSLYRRVRPIVSKLRNI
jgi:FkbM family methyltransferase